MDSPQLQGVVKKKTGRFQEKKQLIIQQYEEKIEEWDMYPDGIKPTIYLLGKFGELGECIEKIINDYEKFHKIGKRQMKLALEIGDVYWYVFRFMKALGYNYSEIMKIKVTIHKSKNPLITLLRIVVQVGKISNDFKKIFRDHGGRMEKRQTEYAVRIAKLIRYLNHFLSQIGFTFDEVIEMNYEKLDSRFKRNKIKGSGDSR